MDYETAKELFDYDPDTGLLTWKVRPGACSKVKIGDVAGSPHKDGYIRVTYKRKMYMGHRLAWLLTTKAWPLNQIDHINGIPDDNRLRNLREATRGENDQNRKSYSNTGVSGVHFTKKGYYRAGLMVNGKYILNTDFKTFDEAVAAVTEAKKKYHTFNPDMVTR